MGRHITEARPSPAIVVAALALVAALAGTALAGTDATTSAINKKKVKKIATKQINKLAPGLSVAEAANADALGGQPASAFASKASEPYHEVNEAGQPPFKNGWGPNGEVNSTAAFYKDPFGVVHLKGDVNNGAPSTSPIFTLPPGYRPAKILVMPVSAIGAGDTIVAALLRIRPNGDVVPACASGGCYGVGFDGLTFRAGS